MFGDEYNYKRKMLKLAFVLYFLLFGNGILSKSIQNDTLDNRIASLEKMVDKLEARINKTENSIEETNDHKKAAFYARLTSTKILNYFSTIQFDSVILNEGGHYNPTDGVFVAPVSGVYMFAWSTLTYNGNVFTELRVDGTVKGTLGSIAASGHYIPASMSLVCHVTKGYHVWVQTSNGASSNKIEGWKDSTSFMGLFLYKD